jgi:hypothetical protein
MSLFKRGASFSVAVLLDPVVSGQAVTDLTGWTGKSTLRRMDGTLVQDLTFEWVDRAARTVALSATSAQTALWPKGDLAFDVALTSPDVAGVRVVSGTVKFAVSDALTLTLVAG